LQNIQQVANRGAACRSNDSNSARKFWEHALSCRIKKSFGFEFSFERFELRLQQTESARLQNLYAQLVLTARFENGNVAVKLHLRSIDRWLPQRRHRVAKDHARDLRARIPECEILMPARMQFVIGDFALHPDGAEFRFERAADCACELRDRENLCALGEEIVSELHS
jgi:hypothetical protein